MSFLHPLLLLGAFGVALPILAHLLNRHQVRHTEWAAMQFLNRNVRVRSRQIKLRDLVLLLLRCAALLLLVIAIARPALTSGSWFPGERRSGVVIALDSTFSMGHGGQGGTRFAAAMKQVDVIRDTLAEGDPVTVAMLGGDKRVVLRNLAYDAARFEAACADLSAGPGTLDLATEPGRLAALLTDMEAPQKEVYIITDAQGKDWRQPSARLRDALAGLGTQADVFVLAMRSGDANLAVTDLELVSGVLRKGTTARYGATVKNCGSTPASAVTVQCRVDGVEIDRKVIPLIGPGDSETVSLFVPFHNAGATKITAEIAADELAADNVRRAVAVIRDQVSVLCVDGSAGDAGRLVVAALEARAGGRQANDASVRTVPWLSLPDEDLSQVDVIVLADVPEITPEQAKQLQQFVRRGNGLVWFGGDQVKAGPWNERAAGAETALLPAVIRGPMPTSDSLGAGRPLDADLADHPVCQPLQSLPEDLLAETRFMKLFEAEPMPSSFPVLRLAGSGAPVLLEKRLGRGQVFQFMTTADTTWNNMALTPVFPLVMQQIVTYLTSREFERPRTVGDSLTLTYAEEPNASDAVFDTPSGGTVTVPVREVRGQFVALLEDADEAGYYTARVSVQAAGLPIAVNVDTRESSVACLDDAELRANLEPLGLRVVAAGELAEAIDATRTGRSSWRLFMAAALAFLLIECLLADRMLSRGRGLAAAPTDLGPATA